MTSRNREDMKSQRDHYLICARWSAMSSGNENVESGGGGIWVRLWSKKFGD